MVAPKDFFHGRKSSYKTVERELRRVKAPQNERSAAISKVCCSVLFSFKIIDEQT